jgi:hypothetical protein
MYLQSQLARLSRQYKQAQEERTQVKCFNTREEGHPLDAHLLELSQSGHFSLSGWIELPAISTSSEAAAVPLNFGLCSIAASQFLTPLKVVGLTSYQLSPSPPPTENPSEFSGMSPKTLFPPLLE